MPEATQWLSVLVPAYNAAPFVAECLGSILSQWQPGVELVVIDDGSTDSTRAVVTEVARRHPGRVTLARHEHNQGLSVTRNELIRAANGEYVWFIDADDLLIAGAIRGLRAIVNRHAPDLVLCDYLRTSTNRVRRGSSFAGPSRTIISDTSTILAALFEAGQLHPWSKISRRALWSEPLEFPHGRVFEDVTVMPRLACRASTVYHEPEPWVSYRKWAGSIVATMNPRKCIDLVRASAEFPAAVQRRGLRLSDRALFASRHYAARHFIRAMRHLAEWHEQDASRHARGECLALFEEAIEGQSAWLMRRYLQRGWLYRGAQLRYWMSRAARESSAVRMDGERAVA